MTKMRSVVLSVLENQELIKSEETKLKLGLNQTLWL